MIQPWMRSSSPEVLAPARRCTTGVCTSLFAHCPAQHYSAASVRVPGSMPKWGCSMGFLRRIARSPIAWKLHLLGKCRLIDWLKSPPPVESAAHVSLMQGILSLLVASPPGWRWDSTCCTAQDMMKTFSQKLLARWNTAKRIWSIMMMSSEQSRPIYLNRLWNPTEKNQPIEKVEVANPGRIYHMKQHPICSCRCQVFVRSTTSCEHP